MIEYSATGTNVICDGNSLVFGFNASAGKSMPSQLRLLPPLNGVVPVRNVAVSGISIPTMRGRGQVEVDNRYVAGRSNILVAWEGTNTIYGSSAMTGVRAGEEMAAYCADRLAAHPDQIIILLTTLPRFQTDARFGTNVAAGNAQLDAYDAYLKANWQAMGAKGLVDVRASGIFTYTGPTMNSTMSPYMSDLIHCNDAGYGLVAKMVADGLVALAAQGGGAAAPGRQKLRVASTGKLRLRNGRIALTAN